MNGWLIFGLAIILYCMVVDIANNILEYHMAELRYKHTIQLHQETLKKVRGR